MNWLRVAAGAANKLRSTDLSISHMRLVLHHISYVRLTDGCKIFVLPSEACQALRELLVALERWLRMTTARNTEEDRTSHDLARTYGPWCDPAHATARKQRCDRHGHVRMLSGFPEFERTRASASLPHPSKRQLSCYTSRWTLTGPSGDSKSCAMMTPASPDGTNGAEICSEDF